MKTNKETALKELEEIKAIREEVTNRIETLESDIQRMNEDETTKRWKPIINESYFYLYRGEVRDFLWANDYADKWYYRQRNCFKTIPEAETHIRRLEIEEWLNDHTKEFEVDKDNAFLRWNNVTEKTEYCYWVVYYTNKWCMTEANCKKAIELFGNDLKLVLTL